LADEPAAAAPAVPAFEPEAAPVAEEKFFEPAPSEPAVAFDFTGDLGLGETQQFAMPQETPDPNPPAFAFEPAAEAAPSAEPEAPAFAAEVESPFAAPVPFAASPVAPSRAAAQPAAPKLSFVDKIKMLLGLGGAKKKGAAKKGAKASPAGGLEATAAAAAAPIAVPKFGSSIAADAPIPLAEDAPIPLFGEEPIAASQAIDDAAPQIHVTPPEGAAESLFDELAMMDAEPAAPVTESPALAGIAPPVEEPKVDVAPEIEVAPPAGEAESLFDELAMMEGAPSADSPGLTFGEPPAIHHPVAFHFTSDLGLAESKPFELPHTPAAAEPVIPPLVESSPADVAPVADEAQSLFDELEMMSGAPSADSLGPKFSEPATTQPHVSIDFTGNLGIGETKHFAMPHTPAAETPAAASSDAFDDFLADLAPAAETPAVEPPAEISPIAAAAEEAKSELHDLFASFTGAEAEPQAAAEPSAPVAVEPVLEAPAIEVAPPTGEANSLLDELAMMEGAPSADSLGHKLSEAVDSHPAVSIDFTGDLGLADSKPFEMPHTHDAEAAPSPLAEAAAAELAVTETPGAEASPFDELFAPDDQPELAAADANSSTPLDVTTNFVPPQDLQPEPASPFTWDEPVASPTSEAADIPISAELAAPMMGVAQEIAAPVESPVIGATRPYVIDVDVRHTYLNRLAVRIAAKMSKLDIPDLEPEMPAGRSFNRVGKPPESMPTVEAPAAGEALFVTSEVADVPAPAFDSWQQQGVEDSPAAFAAEAAFDMPETSVEASIADPPAADVIDLASLFGESTPAESVADAAPPSTEGLTALFTMPMEDTPAAPEAAALPSLEEPKPDAQAKAESKPKDDDLDSFLNDLGMG
jgi:hypothetical protein